MAPRDLYAAFAAEGKALFGPQHVLETVNSTRVPFLVKTSVISGVTTTVVNLCEGPVARAVLKYGRGVLGQEHALLHDRMELKWTPIKSMDPRPRGWAYPEGMAEKKVSSHVTSHAFYTSSMTMNAHAADFVRYEYEKYSHLKGCSGRSLLRAIPLLTRAYIKTAADLYSVDGVDLDRLTAGMALDDIDGRIVELEAKLLLDVRRQRLRGPRVDVRRHMAALDRELGRQDKLFADE